MREFSVQTVQDLPEYKQPPVVEVVFGIHFKELKNFLTPYLGLLWERFRSDYPICQEVPPLAPVIERFSDSPITQTQLEISDLLPPPRVWFIHSHQNGIIQVQRDRFLHNWKKIRPNDEYPSYEKVNLMFKEKLSIFESFLAEFDIGTLEPLQYELTYVDQIAFSDEFNSLAKIGNVLRDFCWQDETNRFLSEPESINWRTSFLMPDRVGRVHVAIRNALRREDREPIMVLELTARGLPIETSRSAMWEWFDLAHKRVVERFADLIKDDFQNNVWRRIR